MAVSIRNIEKFLDDNQVLLRISEDRRQEILGQARQASGGNRIIPGGVAIGIMGDLAQEFFAEVMNDPEHITMGLEDLQAAVSGWRVPKDKSFPPDSVQCGDCGGNGCETCGDKGWLTPSIHPKGRRCEYAACQAPLPPNHVAVYCTNECARLDA